MTGLITTAEALSVSTTVPDSTHPVIGTHSGTFHCDEALATAMLKMTDGFRDAVVVRSREPEILAACNVVVDVGGVYDPEKLLFDHHQKEFSLTMTTPSNTYKTKLSSAGLVYLHFGQDIIRKVAPEATSAEVDVVFDSVYKSFVEHIDGIDNGVEPFSAADGGSLVKNYSISTSLSSRVGALAPQWNQPSTPADFHDAFKRAVELTGREFLDSVQYFVKAWLPARQVVQTSITDRLNVHESGTIVVFHQFCPWAEHLFQVEKEIGVEGKLLYVLFPSDGAWRVRAIGVEGSTFGMRKALPWKGLRDGDLSEACGVPGCVFVHASGFIGGNKTYEGALQMAVNAMKA
ncbi:UPF0160 protein [Diplonema papillatum]|nr:UPF0160 protein [Diplonema papillatum]